jgi:hypothetical protein
MRINGFFFVDQLSYNIIENIILFRRKHVYFFIGGFKKNISLAAIIHFFFNKHLFSLKTKKSVKKLWE